SRALITAEASVVRLEREPGREPLPELTLEPGTSTLWDGRFQVTVGRDYTGGGVLVRALGDAGLRELRRHRLIPEGAAKRAAAAVPSFWHQGTVVAVPPLGYWAAVDE